MNVPLVPRRRGRLLAAAAVLALAAAGCGSSSTDTGQASSSSTQAPVAAGGTTVPGAVSTLPTLPGGTATSAPAGGSATSAKAAADPNAPRLDPAALQGQAVTVDGQPVDLASLADKDLVVWFWAPW